MGQGEEYNPNDYGPFECPSWEESCRRNNADSTVSFGCRKCGTLIASTTHWGGLIGGSAPIKCPSCGGVHVVQPFRPMEIDGAAIRTYDPDVEQIVQFDTSKDTRIAELEAENAKLRELFDDGTIVDALCEAHAEYAQKAEAWEGRRRHEEYANYAQDCLDKIAAIQARAKGEM